MAEMTIRLQVDPVTRKKNILVALRSDEDLLPHEHEQMHRQLVEKLIHKGLLEASEVGQIVVEREETDDIPEDLPQPERTERRKQSEGQ